MPRKRQLNSQRMPTAMENHSKIILLEYSMKVLETGSWKSFEASKESYKDLKSILEEAGIAHRDAPQGVIEFRSKLDKV
jgi:hypothetical protein